ncbi:MAG: hypothetical protein P1V97_33795, partial [Planctomycetota bacterium]|nr:hypothetical protein [Planctomycetota bacterium]
MAGTINGELEGQDVSAQFSYREKEQGTPNLDIHSAVQSDLYIDIQNEGYSTLVEKMTGSEELVLGHREFDSTFYVHTSNKEMLTEVLTQSLMEAFVRANPSRIYVENGTVVLHFS